MNNQPRRFWENYWAMHPVTVTAHTMTQVLDQIKWRYLHHLLPSQGHTLEVGSGSGRLSCLLAMAGYDTVCVDYSRNALESARANFATSQVRGQFIEGEGACLPVNTDSVDVVLSTGLLEHFEDPSPVVKEMVRVLKPGGIFYSDIVPRKFSLFRSLDWIGRLKRKGTSGQALQEEFFERRFTRAEILDLLVLSGLTDATVFPAGVVPPYLPVVSRCQALRDLQVSLVQKTRALWRSLDNTFLAEWLGFYYFAWAVKPQRIS